MNANRWTQWSRYVYRLLLRLYPPTYRASYEVEMLRVFTDQCRDAYQKDGSRGIALLWPRTLVDVVITILHEHLTDTQATLGLLEAVPNAPVPWKGVLLVLIPGLIFFVSQVAQLTSDQDWFFAVFYRGAYFLILPVLVTWLVTRRFPIWGLIPLGLLYETLQVYSKRLPIQDLPLYNEAFRGVDIRYLLLVPTLVAAIGILLWIQSRKRRVSKAAWRCIGIYALLSTLQVAGEVYQAIVAWHGDGTGQGWLSTLALPQLHLFFAQVALSYLYESLSLFLLALIGMAFARKHGGLAILILLGYLLPTVLYGRYGTFNNATPFYLVSLMVVLYRFVMALVTPVWVARASSNKARERAVAIPVAVAILSQLSLTVISFLMMSSQNAYQPTLIDFAMVVWNPIMMVAGLALALALYLPTDGSQATFRPPLAAEAS